MVLKLITCKDEFEAEVIKGALADMGIESILQGKNMSQIYGGIGAMSVNILVDEKDYEQARAFIDSREMENYEPEEELPKQRSTKEIVKESLCFSAVYTICKILFDAYKGELKANCLAAVIDTVLTLAGTFVIGFCIWFGIKWLEREYFKHKETNHKQKQ